MEAQPESRPDRINQPRLDRPLRGLRDIAHPNSTSPPPTCRPEPREGPGARRPGSPALQSGRCPMACPPTCRPEPREGPGARWGPPARQSGKVPMACPPTCRPEPREGPGARWGPPARQSGKVPMACPPPVVLSRAKDLGRGGVPRPAKRQGAHGLPPTCRPEPREGPGAGWGPSPGKAARCPWPAPPPVVLSRAKDLGRGPLASPNFTPRHKQRGYPQPSCIVNTEKKRPGAPKRRAIHCPSSLRAGSSAWSEHRTFNPSVLGSNPSRPTPSFLPHGGVGADPRVRPRGDTSGVHAVSSAGLRSELPPKRYNAR